MNNWIGIQITAGRNAKWHTVTSNIFGMFFVHASPSELTAVIIIGI